MKCRIAGFGLLMLVAACGRQFASIPTSPTHATTPPGALAATVDPQAIAPLGTSQIVASQGYPPYTWVLLSAYPDGGARGSIDGGGTAATYRADATGPVEISIQVSDSDGGSVAVTLSVGLPLVLSPPIATLAPGGALTFFAQYGQPPYRYLAGAAACGAVSTCTASTIDPSLGTYTASPTCGGDTDCVLAVDSNDAGSAAALIRITQGPVISPSSVAINAGEALALSVGGGVPPYLFSFARHGNLSGGTITADGRYQSGPNPNETDTLQVSDATGLTSTAQVNVGNPVFALANSGTYRLLPTYSGLALRESLLAYAFSAGAATTEGDVELLTPTSHGFALFQSLPQQTPPCAASLADLNGDGLVDLVLQVQTIDTCDTVQMFFGQSDGQFAPGPTAIPLLLNGELDPVSFAVPLHLPGAAATPLVVVEGHADGSVMFYPDGGFGLASEAGLSLDVLMIRDGGAMLAVAPVAWFNSDQPGSIASDESSLAFTYLDDGTMTYQAASLTGAVGLSDGGIGWPTPAIQSLSQFPAAGPPPQVGMADLDGDGFPDLYAYSIDPFAAGLLVGFLLYPDAGAAGPFPVPLPPATDITAAPPTALTGLEPSALDVAGPTGGTRIVWSGTALQTIDAGFLPATSIAEGIFNAAGITDLVFAGSSGQLTQEVGALPTGFATGNGFHYTAVAGGVTLPVFSVGDVDGDGRADVLVGGVGFSLYGGTPVGLSTEATWLADAEVLAVAAAPSGAWALAIPPGQGEELVHVSWDDGGWSLSELALADAGFTATSLVPMWAGGDVAGGDLLLSGPSPTAWVFQAFVYTGGQARPSALSVNLPAFVIGDLGDEPLAVSAAPFSTDGGAVDCLAIQLGNTNTNNDGFASVDVASPTGVPPSWNLEDGGFGDGDADHASGCATQITEPIVPLPLRPGQRPSRWVALQSEFGEFGADGGVPLSADGGDTLPVDVCVFDPTQGTTPAPTGQGFWGGLDGPAVGGFDGPAVVPFIGDINGDGLNDLLLLVNNQVQIGFGLGQYAFAAPGPMPTLPGYAINLVGVGDINGDGFGDAVIADTNSSELFVLYGQPDGGLH